MSVRCRYSLSVFAVGIRCRYSLSVVDGDGVDRDGRADHGVVAYAGDRVAGRGELSVAGRGETAVAGHG